MAVDMELTPKTKRAPASLLRTGRLPRRRARRGGPDGVGRQGARATPSACSSSTFSASTPARSACASSCRCSTSPNPPCPSPQGAARGRDRRLRAPGPVGLLLRHPRRPRGAVRMAELNTECCTPDRPGDLLRAGREGLLLRRVARSRAAAARQDRHRPDDHRDGDGRPGPRDRAPEVRRPRPAAAAASGAACCSPAEDRRVRARSLYAGSGERDAPRPRSTRRSAVACRPRSLTCTTERSCSISGRAPARTC